MNAEIYIRNKKTQKILQTEIDGLFCTINFMADGEVEIVEIGTCIDDSNILSINTKEIYLNKDDYEIISITFN